MKESVKIKLLVTGLLIVLMTACAIAQNEVRVDLTVKIDNYQINDTSYVLHIVNYDTGEIIDTKTSSSFILHLDYNSKFEISISHKGTNTKTIIIDTNAPIDDWYIISSINLNTNDNKRILAGGIKYDTLLRTFKKYK